MGTRRPRFSFHGDAASYALFSQPVLAGCLNSSGNAPDQRDHEQYQEDQEQDSRYTRCREFDSCESEQRRNEGDNKEDYRPIKHNRVLLSTTLNARTRTIAGSVVSRSFPSRGNIFGARLLQDLLRALHPFGVVAVDRQQDSARLDAPFVALGFVFRNTHADQRADHSPDSPASTSAGQ